MRKITKLMLTLALFVVGLGVNAGNHYLEVTTNAVKANAWEWAIWYQLDTSLETGKTYVLTMDAKCSEEYDMAFWPKNTGEGGTTQYTGYKIGTEWSTCTCEFTANDDLNRLVWNFGSLNGFLRFDNVKLVEKGSTTNLIVGSDFESGLASNWGNDGWNKPEYSIYESENTPARCLKITTDRVKDYAWEWAIWYKLDTPLEKDKTYVLTMKAKCSEAYNMSFWPYKQNGQTNYKGYNIGTEWGDCSCTFTAADDLDYLKWCFGSLNGTVYFDDVCLVEQGQSTNLINGGDFEDGMASNWGDDGWNKPNYGIVLEYPAVEAAVPVSEVQLTQSMFKGWTTPDADAEINSNYPYWSSKEYGETVQSGDVMYGNPNVGYLEYANLSNYSGMVIYGSGSDLRVLMNRVSDGGALTELRVSPSPSGTFVDFSSYSFVHLNAIKVVNGGGETTVTNITLIDPTVIPSTDYMLSGDIKDGAFTASAIAALADESAKVIDVTTVAGRNVELASANPNCLFIANAGKLTNENNVIVDGTCANLILTDGYPFALPEGVAATTASYTRTMPNTFGTICLPYAVTSDGDVQYYTADGVAGDALVLDVIQNVAAGTPAIVFAEGKSLSINGSGTLAVAGKTDDDVKLIGSYTEQVIDVTEDASKNYYGIANNQFTKATSTLTVKPFRAYLTTAASSPAKLRLGLADDEASAISVLTAEDATVKAIYNAAGAKQQRLQKGLNIVKMSNGTTTKVFVK